MDLHTDYLGLMLSSPLIVGASPLARDVAAVRKLERHGAGAVVMYSLFEEEIEREELSLHHHAATFEDSHAEALSYLPEPEYFYSAPESYLDQIVRLKKTVSIPIIASLNGVSNGGWTRYARLMQEAGADAIELNLYYTALDPEETAATVEQRYVDVVGAVTASVTVPVAVKLSSSFSAPVDMAKKLDAAGAAALVVFNRFYEPDIDIDHLDVVPALRLSDSHTLLPRLRWLAAMFGHVACSLAATGGVHTGRDALKALMAGASAVQITSALLRDGPGRLAELTRELREWMTDNEYESVRQLIGSMSLARCPEPAHFERANYMRVLKSWRFGTAV